MEPVDPQPRLLRRGRSACRACAPRDRGSPSRSPRAPAGSRCRNACPARTPGDWRHHRCARRPDSPCRDAGRARVRSNRRGSAKTVSSLLAEMSATRTIAPAGIVVPYHSASRRSSRVLVDDDAVAPHELAERRIDRAGSDRTAASTSGCWSRTAMKLARPRSVVSPPATIISAMKEAISWRDSRSPASVRPWAMPEIRSGPGASERASMSVSIWAVNRAWVAMPSPRAGSSPARAAMTFAVTSARYASSSASMPRIVAMTLSGSGIVSPAIRSTGPDFGSRSSRSPTTASIAAGSPSRASGRRGPGRRSPAGRRGRRRPSGPSSGR